MGTTNYGNQTITIQFLDSVDSGVVNKLTKDVLPVGIYSGGKITKVSNTSVTIDSLVVLISDGTYQATIRTASTVTLAVSSSTPYIILRWVQPTATGYYMDFMAVAEGNIQEHDLIVGKCIYSGSTMTGVSYENKTYPVNLNLFCKVVPEETPSMRVKVLDGWVSVNGTFHRIEAQYTSTIAAPSLNPRIDLVYIDESGTVQIETGTESASPIPPSHEGKIPLAHIYLQTTTTSITENEIIDIRAFLNRGFNILDHVDNVTIRLNGSDQLQVYHPLGSWVSRSNNTVYYADTDGFVCAYVHTTDDTPIIYGYTDSNNPPTTLRVANKDISDDAFNTYAGFSMPVRKGDYWRVVNAHYIYWMPLGT